MIKTEPYLPFEANTLHDDTDLVDVRNRKSAEATEMSAPGGKADFDFGRLEVCF